MRAIINPSKQKFIVVAVAALVAFFGFQAASFAIAEYQIGSFLKISFYVYLFVVVWQTFIFDLHLKPTGSWKTLEHSLFRALRERFAYLKERRHWLHFQNYLILPGVIFWSTAVLLYLNPFDDLRKQVWLTLSTLSLAIAVWYLKTVFYAHSQASRIAREMIFLTKLYGSFVAIVAAFGITRYFGMGPSSFAMLVFGLIFLLMYQALFQHHSVEFKMLKFLLVAGISLAFLGYALYLKWNANFYTGTLVLTTVYNTVWGLIQHRYIEKNLTKEIVFEYLAVLFVILVILISTTNFAQRI